MDEDRIVSLVILVVGFTGIAIGCSGKATVEPAVGFLMVLFAARSLINTTKMSRTRG